MNVNVRLADPTGPVFANSYSWLLRNVLLERIKLLPPFATEVAKFSRVNARPMQAEDIPYLGVYLMPDEELDGRGANNMGPAQFLHRVNVGFSYVIQNNDPEACEDALDRGHWAIMSLLHDPDWHKWPTSMGPMARNPDRIMMQGITKAVRRHVYGTVGKDNETPVGEMQMEWTCVYGSDFEPIIADIFESMWFKAVYPWPEDPNRQAIFAEWMMET